MRIQGDLVTTGPGRADDALFLKRFSLANQLQRWFLRLPRRLETGRLTIVLPDGEKVSFAGRVRADGAEAVLVLRRPRAIARFLIGGNIGMAESYIDGDWESPDLAALFRLAECNRNVLARKLDGLGTSNMIRQVRKLMRANTLRGSRRNIAFHYDLGNAFYRLWLDSSMTYSSAFYEHDGQSLPDAQAVKYRRIADMLGLEAGHKVLEIGCGWGGFAEFAAKEVGCAVTAITLSREQLDFARKRMVAAGVADRVEIRLQDYREARGRYDRIASIEMIEAVGEENWPTYFRTIHDRLAPGGAAALQAITIADDRFEHYRHHPDFIQQYVFPGGMLPSPACLSREIDRQGLRLTDTVDFGESYARTLAIWAQDFERAWPRIRSLGFDDRFKRMWEFYLAYCEVGFRVGATDVTHLRIERD